jgi:hypothetical protein
MNIKVHGISTYLGHLGINLHAEVLHVRILGPLEHTDTMSDGLKPLLGSSNGKLDHGSGLNRLASSQEDRRELLT